MVVILFYEKQLSRSYQQLSKTHVAFPHEANAHNSLLLQDEIRESLVKASPRSKKVLDGRYHPL